MTIISPHRLVLVALAMLVGLVVAASPAAATDDPAPRPAPQGGAQPGGGAAPAGAQAPAASDHKRAAKRAAKRASKRVRVRVRHRKHHRGVRISLTGPGLKSVTRIDVLAHGRRIARDSSRPFRLVINGRRLGKTKTVQIRLVQGGSVRTITRRLRAPRGDGAAHSSAFESLGVAMALDSLLGRFELS